MFDRYSSIAIRGYYDVYGKNETDKKAGLKMLKDDLSFLERQSKFDISNGIENSLATQMLDPMKKRYASRLVA